MKKIFIVFGILLLLSGCSNNKINIENKYIWYYYDNNLKDVYAYYDFIDNSKVNLILNLGEANEIKKYTYSIEKQKNNVYKINLENTSNKKDKYSITYNHKLKSIRDTKTEGIINNILTEDTWIEFSKSYSIVNEIEVNKVLSRLEDNFNSKYMDNYYNFEYLTYKDEVNTLSYVISKTNNKELYYVSLDIILNENTLGKFTYNHYRFKSFDINNSNIQPVYDDDYKALLSSYINSPININNIDKLTYTKDDLKGYNIDDETISYYKYLKDIINKLDNMLIKDYNTNLKDMGIIK